LNSLHAVCRTSIELICFFLRYILSQDNIGTWVWSQMPFSCQEGKLYLPLGHLSASLMFLLFGLWEPTDTYESHTVGLFMYYVCISLLKITILWVLRFWKLGYCIRSFSPSAQHPHELTNGGNKNSKI
jgi:hypothetical protein